MKKLYYIGLLAGLTVGFSSCNADTDPKIDTTQEYEFLLNTPPLAQQFVDLSTGGNLSFTLSQPAYGVTLAPTYGLQMSLSPDFQPIVTAPVVDSSGEEHEVPGVVTLNLDGQVQGVLTVSMAKVATGINQLTGSYDEETYVQYEGPAYFRATSSVGDGEAANLTMAVSNVVTMTQIKGFGNFSSIDAFFMSVPGAANGWNAGVNYESDTWLLVSQTEGAVYQGFAFIDGEFKFSLDADWADNRGGELVAAGTQFTAQLVPDGSNFNVGGEMATGLYFFKVDWENNTMTATPITSISIVGDYNGWGVDTGEVMTDAGSFKSWTAKGAFTSSGWKFVFNDSWDVNLGLSKEAKIPGLWWDGDNINEDATTVTLNLAQFPWSYTVE